MGNVAVRNPRKIYSQYNDAGAIAILSNNVYKVTYYEIITGASGTLTVPTGATINAGEFSGANCILSEIDGNNKPTYVTPLDGGGTPVTATLNVGTGAWVKSAATVSVNVALIYSLNISAINYQNLNNFYIIEDVLLAQINVGTTTITSGTNTRILYNNNGVVGEYTVTGTGTTAVLSTSPTFTTDITTPLIKGVAGVLQTFSTDAVNVGNAVTTNQKIFRVGQGNINIDLGSFGSGFAGMWMTQLSPTTSNYTLVASATQFYLSAPTNGNFLINGVAYWGYTTSGISLADNFNLILNTSTGNKIGTATTQKIGFWNATPIVQPTTAVAASTLTSNGGTTLTSTDTIDGYTLLQVVKALRNTGLLQ